MESTFNAGEEDFRAFCRTDILLVGETFDGLNKIDTSRIEKEHVVEAIQKAQANTNVLDGNYGGGTTMCCHGHKGGIGASPRFVPWGDGEHYTLEF